ncbi:ABC transporter ATP-binding protein [Ruixingdingia sedimenti]|uniref:ABC transporter ATP-binding protein n=1 Tax=Ruixingdingia sedimenti TaxID=3073604 RepID=A0ABU1FCH4_9RHOB|nr:ABC transporter ATP-binding protein [Xinfangfangia sp. LG-4]MDR5654589.1 ABC transporter ATP-binding protein [Xinfangfangia sp. LG-4]
MGLSATGIAVHFSGVRAVDDVSVSLSRGEILGLVGPNGAGKTTMVNVFSGFQPPHRGAVALEGAAVTGRDSAWLARNGVVRTFQAVRLFHGLSVSENVEAALTSLGHGRAAARRRALEMLDYLGIAGRAQASGGALNYGDERRVGIARALALQPRFLLLDEPAAGMNVAEAAALSDLIRRIRDDFGCGVLLIEHNMSLITRTCERMHVMASGRTIAAGTPAEVFADPGFRAAYLGLEEGA